MDFELDFKLDFEEEKIEEHTKQETDIKKKKIHTHKTGKRHVSRKYTSETILSNSLPWQFEDGECYHCISMGDVDSFSYCKHVLKSHKFDSLLLSTWCMAGEDVEEIESYLERGILKNVDFYVGEIFPKTYKMVYEMVLKLSDKYGSRCCIFRNHSKVMVLKSNKLSCVIESSANINTNPRVEQTVITFDSDLADFYIDFYENINNFNQENDKTWKK